MLDDAVDGAGEDDSRAEVQRRERALHVPGFYSSSETPAVEESSEQAERCDNNDLDDQTRLHENMSEILQVLREVLVRDVGHANRIHHLNNSRHKPKSRERTSRMQRRKVRDVVQNPP